MYFETLRSPDEVLCPVGTVLTVSEAAQLTEHNATGLREIGKDCDAMRIDHAFAFKVLKSLDEAGRITTEDMAFAWADDDVLPSEPGYPPALGPLNPLVDESDEDEEEGDGLR